MQGATVHGHRPALTVHHVVRLHPGGVQCGRVGNQLEGRSRLVDVAHRKVGQGARFHVPRVVRVEPRRNRQRQNLPGVRVLHHHRAMQRLHLVHLFVQRALSHMLNVGVDGEHQVLARHGLALHAAHHATLGIHRGQHVPGNTVHLVVELQLQSAETRIFAAHITQYLRGQIVVRIEALEFFAEIDALQIQLLDASGGIRIHPPRNPGKMPGVVEAREHLGLRREPIGRVGMHHLGQHLRRTGAVLAQLGRIYVDGILLHRHRQFAQIAVVENPALRRNRERVVLLALRLVHPLGVAHHLQPSQPQADGEHPRAEEDRHPGKTDPAYWRRKGFALGLAGSCAHWVQSIEQEVRSAQLSVLGVNSQTRGP